MTEFNASAVLGSKAQGRQRVASHEQSQIASLQYITNIDKK
jgi:hypothetical protein